jgi:hypothetical protein
MIADFEGNNRQFCLFCAEESIIFLEGFHFRAYIDDVQISQGKGVKMMEDETDQEIVFNKLEGLREEIERIREVLERRYFDHLTFADRDEAQGLMRDLEKKLTDEYERCNTKRTRREQNQTEIDPYWPALYAVKACIKVKTNSVPNEEWDSQLHEALIHVDHHISQLKKKK